MNAYDPGKQGKGRAIPPRVPAKPTMLIGALKLLTLPFLAVAAVSVVAYVAAFAAHFGTSNAILLENVVAALF